MAEEVTDVDVADEGAPRGFSIGRLREVIAKLNHGPPDLLCVDVGSTGIKAVRMKRGTPRAEVTAAAILPHPGRTEAEGEVEIEPLEIAAELRARQVSLAVTSEHAIVKLLSFPGAFTAGAEGQIVTSLGIEDVDANRIGYKLVSQGHGRTESKVLAAAMPHHYAEEALALFPNGLPAPYSVEISALAALTAFIQTVGPRHGDAAIGVIDLGATVSYFALFVRQQLTLIRKFNFGTETAVAALQQQLGVDRETAFSTLSASSIDLSQQIAETAEPLAKQLIISRDFVERRHGATLEAVYVTGSIAGSVAWDKAIENALGPELQRWSPFDGVEMADGVLSEELHLQGDRFAAAIGIGLGTFEDT